MTIETLLQMNQSELDELYCAFEGGSLPLGFAKGILVLAPGTVVGRILQAVVRMLVWKGKIFVPGSAQLVNVVTPFRFEAVHADVYNGPSWLDGNPATVFDYSKRSFVARKVRDEVREVAPGLFLGKAFWGRRRVVDFVLESAAGDFAAF